MKRGLLRVVAGWIWVCVMTWVKLLLHGRLSLLLLHHFLFNDLDSQTEYQRPRICQNSQCTRRVAELEDSGGVNLGKDYRKSSSKPDEQVKRIAGPH